MANYKLTEGLLASKNEKILLAKEREKRKIDELKKKVKAKVDGEEKRKAQRMALIKSAKNHVKNFVFKTVAKGVDKLKSGQKQTPLALPPPLPQNHPGTPPPIPQSHGGPVPIQYTKGQKKVKKLPKIGKLNLKHQPDNAVNPDVDHHIRNHAKWLQAAHRVPDNNLIKVGQNQVNAKQYYFAQAEHHRNKAAEHGVTITHTKRQGNLHVGIKSGPPPPALAETVASLRALTLVNKLQQEDIMSVNSSKIVTAKKPLSTVKKGRIAGVRKNITKGNYLDE